MLNLSCLLADAEVDALDFTALTWLRIAHHQIWDHIRLNPHAYLSWRESDAGETQTMRMERIEALAKRGHAKPVQETVNYLFKPAGLVGAFSGRKGRMQTSRYFDRYLQSSASPTPERRTQKALQELDHGRLDGQFVEDLTHILLGPDKERSSLALEIVVNLRRNRQETSLTILDFVEDTRTKLSTAGKLVRSSSSEHRLAHEIFLALETKLVSTKDVIARFGYPTLVASAYTAQRTSRYEASQIKSLYADIVGCWVSDVRNEPLAATLARQELLDMKFLCIWIIDLKITAVSCLTVYSTECVLH